MGAEPKAPPNKSGGTVDRIVASIRRTTSALARTIGRLPERAYRRIQIARERDEHPMRHAHVTEILRTTERPRTILVVCRGNRCRSPFLAELLRVRLPDISITSAGFVGAGRPVPKDGRTVAAGRGVDLGEHRSRMLDSRIARDADVVLVMDEQQERYFINRLGIAAKRVIVVGDLDTMVAESRAIRDPIGSPVEVFESTFARLERCADYFAAALRAR